MVDPGTHERRSVEYWKCSTDVAYFVHHCCIIDDTQNKGDGDGTMPFRLWPAQRHLLWDLVKNPLVIILKARQLGISWAACGYALHLVCFNDGKLVLLLSQGEVEAMELLRRIMAMYSRLPEWLLVYLPKTISPTNSTTITFDNGSIVRSLPATKKAGRSFTASLIVADEFAQLPWPEETMSAIKPTVDGGGQLIILSTANGVGNLFHRLWSKFSDGLSRFKPIFLSWQIHPDRDQAWYDRTKEESNDPDKHLQEYPSNPTEAFRASGRSRFRPEWLDAQAANAIPVLNPGDFEYPSKLGHIPGLTIWRPKIGAWKMVIGADVAEGDVDGDASTATVIDTQFHEEFAQIHGRWEPAEYARYLAEIAIYYDAMIVVERNNHGHAVLLKLMELCPDRVAMGIDGKPGWLTNVQTKPQTIDFIAEGLRTITIRVRSERTIAEMQVYESQSGGKTSAPSGFYDDCVMSWAVVLGWLKLSPRTNSEVKTYPNPLAHHRGTRSNRGR